MLSTQTLVRKLVNSSANKHELRKIIQNFLLQEPKHSVLHRATSHHQPRLASRVTPYHLLTILTIRHMYPPQERVVEAHLLLMYLQQVLLLSTAPQPTRTAPARPFSWTVSMCPLLAFCLSFVKGFSHPF